MSTFPRRRYDHFFATKGISKPSVGGIVRDKLGRESQGQDRDVIFQSETLRGFSYVSGSH
jgi:hypothetical protein